MLQAFIAFALIWLIAGLSMLARWIAFGRMDSWALEISASALFFNIVYGVCVSESAGDFLHNELARCVILLFFLLAIAAVHFHFLSVCKSKCKAIFNSALQQIQNEAKEDRIFFKQVGDEFIYDDDEDEFSQAGGVIYANLTPEQLFDLEDKKLAYMSKLVILNEAKQLSEASLSVCYSIFIDAFSYNHRGILRRRKKKDGGASKGFRPKKTGVRIALANIINNLQINGMRTLHEDDFNISLSEQKIGLILFDVFEVLALIVGSRLF